MPGHDVSQGIRCAIIYPVMSCQDIQPAYGRTVVISDTHFGEAGALLIDPVFMQRLTDELALDGPVSQVILLGDVWDLWRSDLSSAMQASRPFFSALSGLPGLRSLVLVFGNHDYHLYFNLAESRSLREAGRQGRVPARLDPFLKEDAGPLKEVLGVPEHVEFTVEYPFHLMEWQGRVVMLTHGHQVDFFARRFWWARTSWLARSAIKRVSGVSASDLELYNAPFFEALYLFGRVPEFSDAPLAGTVTCSGRRACWVSPRRGGRVTAASPRWTKTPARSPPCSPTSTPDTCPMSSSSDIPTAPAPGASR